MFGFGKPQEQLKEHVSRVTVRASNGQIIHDWTSSFGSSVSIEKYGARTVIHHQGFWSETTYEPSLGESVEYEVW